MKWKNDVPVLATPILLWLSELACMQAIESDLHKGQMTVGIAHHMQHLTATPVAFPIEISATLTQVEGKRLRFKVVGTDGRDQIVSGEHERAVVNAESFKEKVTSKAQRGV